jgi:hypothetical protein
MGLNMIIESYDGKNYSYAEIADMLKQAGFKNIEKQPLAGPAEIVIGYKKMRQKPMVELMVLLVLLCSLDLYQC